MPVASQMQVAAAAAAATGQPLLAPGPMHQFVPYPQAHAQHYQQPYHTQMVRHWIVADIVSSSLNNRNIRKGGNHGGSIQVY